MAKFEVGQRVIWRKVVNIEGDEADIAAVVLRVGQRVTILVETPFTRETRRVWPSRLRAVGED